MEFLSDTLYGKVYNMPTIIDTLDENIKYFESLETLGLRSDPADVSYRLQYIKKLYEQEKQGGD